MMISLGKIHGKGRGGGGSKARIVVEVIEHFFLVVVVVALVSSNGGVGEAVHVIGFRKGGLIATVW